jgi:hypothetical protein
MIYRIRQRRLGGSGRAGAIDGSVGRRHSEGNGLNDGSEYYRVEVATEDVFLREPLQLFACIMHDNNT